MFRRICAQDKAVFLALCAEFYSGDGVLHPVSPEVFENTFAELMRSDAYLQGYLCEQDGQAAGYALLTLSFSTEVGGRALWLEELYIRKEFRGGGLGGEFLRGLIEEPGPGVKRVRLEAVPRNAGAIALYRRLGFAELPYLQMVYDV